jgi:hypothetical protein
MRVVRWMATLVILLTAFRWAVAQRWLSAAEQRCRQLEIQSVGQWVPEM